MWLRWAVTSNQHCPTGNSFRTDVIWGAMLHSACGACFVKKKINHSYSAQSWNLAWGQHCLRLASLWALISKHSVPARIRAPLLNRAPVPYPFCSLWYLCRKTIKLLEMSQQFRAKSKPTAPDCSLLAGEFKQMLLWCQSFSAGTKQTLWFNATVSHPDINNWCATWRNKPK